MVIIAFYTFLPSIHDETLLHYAKYVFYAPVVFLKKKAYTLCKAKMFPYEIME